MLDVLDRPISPLELEQEAEAEAVQAEAARVEAARRQAVQAPAGEHQGGSACMGLHLLDLCVIQLQPSVACAAGCSCCRRCAAATRRALAAWTPVLQYQDALLSSLQECVGLTQRGAHCYLPMHVSCWHKQSCGPCVLPVWCCLPAAVCRTLAEPRAWLLLLAGLSPAGVGPRPSAPATLPSAVHRAGEGKAMGVRHVSIEDHEGHDRPEEGLHGLADAGSNKGRPDDVVRDKSATGMATVFEKSPFEEPVNPELGGLQLGPELSCLDSDQQASPSVGQSTRLRAIPMCA